jgi:F0F1-type ATP synthase beta subunit
MKQLLPVVLLATIFISCTNASDGTSQASLAGNTTNKKVKTTNTSYTKIRNDIQLQAKGLKVSQAFLVYDNGSLVPENNPTGVGVPVNLRLIIEGGWQPKDGRVLVGASERIESSEGEVLLDEKDLFHDISSVSPEEAQYITLTATISKLNKLYDYFLVSFRVWDKNGEGEVTGNFKLHL